MAERKDSDLTLDGLVHDLNNIFETIQDAAAVLAKDSRHARLAASLERNVRRGQRILDSYLEHEQASLDPALILDRACEFAREFLQAVQGPRLEFSSRIDPGIRLTGNAAAWERVFINLFLNAAQAMGEKDGSVEIAAQRTPQGVEITVADDGPGISQKILPNIFQPGFSTRAKRSGLGLHIVQTLVTECGGSVSASNRPGRQGAEFHILLPGA